MLKFTRLLLSAGLLFGCAMPGDLVVTNAHCYSAVGLCVDPPSATKLARRICGQNGTPVDAYGQTVNGSGIAGGYSTATCIAR